MLPIIMYSADEGKDVRMLETVMGGPPCFNVCESIMMFEAESMFALMV